MHKFFTIGLTALTLSLGAPLAASASVMPHGQGALASLGSLDETGASSLGGSNAQADFSNCRCRRYTRYRVYRYRYYVRYYVYWY